MSYSLQDLCIHELIKQIKTLTELRVLGILPYHLRLKLLDRLSRRGVLSEKMLSQLISPRLREIDLSECHLSDDSSIACLAQCTDLRIIKMNNHSRSSLLPPAQQNITNSGFLSLIPNWSKLSDIQLRGSQFVDDQILRSIAAHCPHIRTVNVSQCLLVTNDGIIALCVCPLLFCLNVSYIAGVSDEGLVALSQCSSHHILSELNLSHCIQITDVGVKSLLIHCPRLRILVIHGCPKLTGSSRQLPQLAQADEKKLRLSQITWTIYNNTPNPQI